MTRADVIRYLKESVRIFFAPVIGACRQMRYELKRIDRDLRRKAQQK